VSLNPTEATVPLFCQWSNEKSSSIDEESILGMDMMSLGLPTAHSHTVEITKYTLGYFSHVWVTFNPYLLSEPELSSGTAG
jgi:hypothetical protein